MIKRIVFLILISGYACHSQGIVKSFFKLSRPEKCWVIMHPFKASYANKCASEARLVSDTIKLDGDKNGGQNDAFRHAYWIALLCRKMNIKKAVNLGKKHEKGNYLDFKKSKKEEGTLPDSVMCKMDLLNNEAGAKIGFENRKKSNKELIDLIRNEILKGNFWVVHKNSKGQYLDCNNKVIDLKQYQKIWNIPKCIVGSDKKPKN